MSGTPGLGAQAGLALKFPSFLSFRSKTANAFSLWRDFVSPDAVGSRPAKRKSDACQGSRCSARKPALSLGVGELG
jgi:hypothetical protein